MEDVYFKFLNQDKLPLLIQPQGSKQANIDSLITFLKDENALFKEQLLCYGAILLRGFHLNSAEHFSLVMDACKLGAPFDYSGGIIPRTKIIENVYKITNPSKASIPMHNEKAYSANFPNHVYLYCVRAANVGGCTPLADARKVWSSLPDELKYKLHTKGILYRKFYYGKSVKQKYAQLIGRGADSQTWMSVFQTDSKHEVECFLKKSGIPFRWSVKGNGLITEEILPAYRHHPVDNKVSWFNQSTNFNYYYNHVYGVDKLIKNTIFRLMLPPKKFLTYVSSYGDGEPISKADAQLMCFAIQKNKISIPWQEGDVMVVDNYLCMHGKEAHSGERLILAGMTH